MSPDPLGQSAEFDRIDADAVCEACGTVNPEDTLFCKSCGNNLRDQRVQRISEGRGMPESEDTSRRTAQWLSKGLTVFGILLIIWTAINVNNENIEKWLFSTQQELTTGANHDSLWTGANRGTYDRLLEQIKEHKVTPDEINNYTPPATEPKGYDGLFFLKSSKNSNAEVIGQAAATQEGDRVCFVALLSRNEEIRGEFEITRSNTLSSAVAAVKLGDQYLPGFGVAQRSEDGTFSCYAQQLGEEEYPVLTAVAYPIHSD